MRKRPFLISLLAVLSIIAGIVLLVTQFLVASSVGLFGSVLMLGMFYIAGGVAMWKGLAVGWWIGAYCCSFEIVRSGYFLLNLPERAGDLGGDRPIEYLYAKYGARAALNALVLLYFFHRSVFHYFQLDLSERLRLFMILTIVSVAVNWFSLF